MRIYGQPVMTAGQVAHRFGISIGEVDELESRPFNLERVWYESCVYYVTETVQRWLTRARVAREFNKSVATVRALEESGGLSYQKGPREVRLFDADDVQELRGQPLGVARRDPWLQRKRRESESNRRQQSRIKSGSRRTGDTLLSREQGLQKHLEASEVLCEQYRQLLRAVLPHLQPSVRRRFYRDPELVELLEELGVLR